MEKKEAVRAVKYSVIFVIAYIIVLPLCYINNREWIEVFVCSVMPIYMAAVTIGLYPFFRYINRGCKLFSLLMLGFCAVIGAPVYILVGVTCGTFSFGSGLAYIIYGYALIVALAVICVSDTLITVAVRLSRRNRG